MTDLTPREIVSNSIRFIIGQLRCEGRAGLRVALRNVAWRRKQLPDRSFREEVYPKYILMIVPTGAGKTEISPPPRAGWRARRFLKVEATKFTEVWACGRDVEQIHLATFTGRRDRHDARSTCAPTCAPAAPPPPRNG